MTDRISDTDRACGSNIFVIIVAAGSGSRFGSDIPKQFLPLAGRPVLCHTVEAFRKALPQSEIVLVLSESGEKYWREICAESGFESPSVVPGGASRTDSVHNALRYIAPRIDGSSLVMIHDGARPLVKPAMIRAVASAFDDTSVEAVLPVVALTEAVSCLRSDGYVEPSDRSSYRTVQTPQAFRGHVLLDAYEHAAGLPLPDDAAVYHAYTGRALATVPGDYTNIKITNPTDIAIASIIMETM